MVDTRIIADTSFKHKLYFHILLKILLVFTDLYLTSFKLFPYTAADAAAKAMKISKNTVYLHLRHIKEQQ